MKINTTDQTPVTVGGEPIRQVESLIYMRWTYRMEQTVTSSQKSERDPLTMLKNIWASRNIRISTTLRTLNSNVKSVLLYGAETCRMTKTTLLKIQTV